MVDPVDIPSFATTQLDLLDRELQAELAETAALTAQYSPVALQRAGLALINLHVSAQRTGLGGKSVIDLELDAAIGQGDLPEHGLRVGDIVGVSEQVGGQAKKREKIDVEKRGVDGVVVKVRPSTIAVALNKEEPEVPAGKLWMTKLANDITYKRYGISIKSITSYLFLAAETVSTRMNQTMTKMQKLSESQQSTFIRVLFGHTSPTPVQSPVDEAIGDVEWVTEDLNDPQKGAIKFAIASPEIALIHGPPGTGKTHTLIELILQLLKRGLKLLVCGPSNISVDNIVERLAPHKVPMVRLGHPARLLPSVLNHSLDILTKTSEAAALVQDIRNEMDAKQASIRKTRNGRERKAIYGDLRELRKEYRERERGCVDGLVRNSKVVLATLHGAGGHQLQNAAFDVIIIDEASQSLEAQCWVPLLSAKKAILAGDHLQLPPTIKSLNSSKAKDQASKNDEGSKQKTAGSGTTLERTLFDRLLTLHGPSIKRLLTIQYRMHEKINQFPSQELYDSELMAADSVKTRLLSELEGVSENDETIEPLIFYDTQGGDFLEDAGDDSDNPKSNKSLGESKSNAMEAALVVQHVKKLVEAGVKPSDIAVITPYNAQLSLLSQALKEDFPDCELGSVDGFQGREKEAVIVTLVRSNSDKEVGFLGEKRRLNVAMTRPRRQLAVVGDSETISAGSAFLKRWMAFLEESADLRYPNPADLDG